MQVIAAVSEFKLALIDLCVSLPDASREAEALKLAETDVQQPLILSRVRCFGYD